MKIQIEYIELRKSFKISKLIRKVLKRAIDMYGSEYDCSIYVGICTDDYIRKINNEHRQINKATDVLSFPMINWDKPADWTNLKAGEDINPTTGKVELGDILISMETGMSQAKEYEHGIDREIAYLALHGLLHLLGYDHMTDDDKKLMREKEENVLSILNIVR